MQAQVQSPLLASTEQISDPQSIAFAVVFSLLSIAMIVKAFRAKSNRLPHVSFLLLCLIRTATYSIRADASSKGTDINNDKGIVIAAAVLLIAGYLFFVEAICSIVTIWVTQRHKIDNPRLSTPIHLAEHLLLTGVSVIGIMGAIHLSNATTTAQISDSKILRIVSGILFAVIILFTAFVVIGTIIVLSSRPKPDPSSEKVERNFADKTMFWILMVLLVCVSIETIYRIWSSATYSGFIIKETAVDVFIFMPEFIATIVWLLVDINDAIHIKWVLSKGSTHTLEHAINGDELQV